jgi:hypothetical protein
MTWEQDIAIPASRANEGRRFVIDTKFAEVSYEIAPIENAWAVSVHCGYFCGDNHICDTPWRRMSSRAECLEFVLDQAKIHFEHAVSFPDQERAQKAVLKVLSGMNKIVEEGLVKLTPAKTHVAKLDQEKPSPGLLF